MSWFKGDDRLHSCEKWAPLSFAARGLWAHANSWVSDRRTDGMVPRKMPQAWGAAPELVQELVIARLWDEVPDGWRFHDWLDYNPSRAELEERALASNARVTAFRERKKRARNAVGNAHVTPLPDPNLKERVNNHSLAAASSLPVTSVGGNLVTFPLPASGDPDISWEAVGASWLSFVTGREPFPVSGKWRQALADLGRKPPSERSTAMQPLTDAAATPGSDDWLTPRHVVDYWHLYRVGKSPGKPKPASRMSEVPTAAEYAAAEGVRPWEK